MGRASPLRTLIVLAVVIGGFVALTSHASKRPASEVAATWLRASRMREVRKLDPAGARHLKVSVSCRPSLRCRASLATRDGLVDMAAERWRASVDGSTVTARLTTRPHIAEYATADRTKDCTRQILKMEASKLLIAADAINYELRRCGSESRTSDPRASLP